MRSPLALISRYDPKCSDGLSHEVLRLKTSGLISSFGLTAKGDLLKSRSFETKPTKPRLSIPISRLLFRALISYFTLSPHRVLSSERSSQSALEFI